MYRGKRCSKAKPVQMLRYKNVFTGTGADGGFTLAWRNFQNFLKAVRIKWLQRVPRSEVK